MIDDVLTFDMGNLPLIALTTAGVFVTVITYTRLAGLRSFSKMSGFDFAMTVAVGSLIASVAVRQVSLVEGMLALAVLYGMQIVIALLRRFTLAKKIVDNTPVLLMARGKMQLDIMMHSRITEEDVYSKLREAGVAEIASVQAVILETTGDISIIMGDRTVDKELLRGVRGNERYCQ